MNLTRLALARPVTISMIFICAVVTGAIATRLLPLEMYPPIEFPGVFVVANYPGSSPEEVERNITRPLEEALATIDGVERMQSNSNGERAQVFMMFGFDVSTKIKSVEAREKVENIRDQLPADLRRINVFTGSANDQPIVEARIAAETDLADSWELLNRELKQRIERIEGVAKVEIHGVAPKSFQIRLDPTRVAAYGIDTNTLLARLQATNTTIAAGEIQNRRQDIRVTIDEQFRSREDIANYVINAQGLRLGDVASIELANDDIQIGRHLGRRNAVGVRVLKQADANLVETAELIKTELDRAAALPDFRDISIYLDFNAAEEVLNALSGVVKAGLLGFVLSTLVLFLFLRDVRLTLVVSLAVPFSITITLAIMYLSGFTLNILSLMGLMLAVGMLVDNAVVISESIFTQQQRHGLSPVPAAIEGVKQVGVPVIAGTMTTAIVFLPNIIGEKGMLTVFLSHVAISIVVALGASLFIATTIIPLFLSRGPSLAAGGGISDNEGKLQRWYRIQLTQFIQHPKGAAIVALALFLSVIIPAQFVEVDFFTNSNNTQLQLRYNIRGTHTLERIESEVNRLEEFLFAHRDELELENVYSWFNVNDAGTVLMLKPEEERRKNREEIRQYVEDHLPKFVLAKPSFERLQGEQGFTVSLRGDDSRTLYDLSQSIIPRLDAIEGVVQTRSLTPDGDRELQIVLDPARLQQLQLTPESVANSVATALRKRQLNTFRNRFGEIDINLSLLEGAERVTTEELAALPIVLADGRQTRLDSMAKFTVRKALPQIRRDDRQTSLVLRLEYSLDDISYQQLRRQVQATLDGINYPSGYGWGFGQQVNNASADLINMMINMVLALMMIFVVMAALFESLLFPIAAISSIAYGIVGVYWFYFATNTTISIMGMIGVLVLMGVAVNNSIVLIDRINFYRDQGLLAKTAVIEAAADRIRPILMTVLTTILGLLPLGLGDAAIVSNGPAYFPLARAVIGGLLYSTITTLFCLPIIYLALNKLREHWSDLWQAAAKNNQISPDSTS